MLSRRPQPLRIPRTNRETITHQGIQRPLLRVRKRSHQPQVVAHRMTFAQPAKAGGASGENAGWIWKTDARDGALAESLNLSGVENSLHGSSSRETRPDDASMPNRVSRCPGSWRVSSP